MFDTVLLVDELPLCSRAATHQAERHGRVAVAVLVRHRHGPRRCAGAFDRARDALVLPLVRQCVERGQPFLGICRGFQEVNVAMGGNLEDIQNGTKNIGSEALSEYIFGKASRENPFDLIGAMFIIEGLGRRVARRWALRIQEQLDLRDDQVKFLLYHSESDDIHFERLDSAVQSGILTDDINKKVIKTAKVVARLYILQLEEIGNF